MGHAKLDDLADNLEGGKKARVSGPIVWADDDKHALIYAMVCQAVTPDTSTVAREVTPLRVDRPTPTFEIEVQKCSGPPFSDGMAAASLLAIFTNDVCELASYAWTDCVHLHPPSAAP